MRWCTDEYDNDIQKVRRFTRHVVARRSEHDKQACDTADTLDL